MNLAEALAERNADLHDALIEHIDLDWRARTATITGSMVDMSAAEDAPKRGARILLKGLVYFVSDPPVLDERRGYGARPDGLWIDERNGFASEEARARLPPTPEGCFVHYLFVHNWNAFIHVCARSAEVEWSVP